MSLSLVGVAAGMMGRELQQFGLDAVATSWRYWWQSAHLSQFGQTAEAGKFRTSHPSERHADALGRGCFSETAKSTGNSDSSASCRVVVAPVAELGANTDAVLREFRVRC